MDDKKDMTRIEDLSEYLHADDPETEAILKESNTQTTPSPLPESELTEEPPSFNEFRPSPLEKEEEKEGQSTIENTALLTEEKAEPLPPPEPEPEAELEPEPPFELPPPEIFEEKITETALEIEPEVFPELEPLPPAPRPNKENFSEIRKFGENINLGVGTNSGHPPYSILIKNIKYKEDAEDILRILKEFKAVKNDNQKEIEKSLEMGNLLLSHLSEFAAIVIAHKIRKYDLDLELGPSEQIHPSLFYNQEKGGPVTKSNYLVNREDYHEFTSKNLTPSDIIVSTSPQLENYQILRYLGIVSEHLTVEANFFRKEQSSHQTEDLYLQLQNELKEKAIKKEGNAVVGINFQITPIRIKNEEEEQSSYQISCTGNVVWAVAALLK